MFWITKKRHEEELRKQQARFQRRLQEQQDRHEMDSALAHVLVQRAKIYHANVEGFSPGTDSLFTVRAVLNTEMAHYVMRGNVEMARVIANDIARKIECELRPLCHMDKPPRVKR